MSHTILDACDPAFAHQVPELDPSAGPLLSRNVVLEPSSTSGTTVSMVDPRAIAPGDEFVEIAGAAAAEQQAAVDEMVG